MAPVLAALVVTACGWGDEDTVDAEHLERSVGQALERTEDEPVTDVSCPGGLRARFAETTRCTATIDGDRYGVEVLITSVDDGDATFDIERDVDPVS
ncbi:DUF4333 domain-containing protein [Haloechinothrix sp. LS1_15]|uniref:DUF4333 domain-containing protein n=1 Tax=Haloechinothrix sp. LS1_15 TaxID=2652248 RepID=UPI002946A9EB|nr:DUF4333 domain-containing protein [Haloechinothrix sp. LS1_15]MDV6014732.1 DUF4333 domain-containing protein [Haloechinothrix sp. LS1_15]